MMGTMRDAQCRKPKWYWSVLRERGRRGLPLTQLYRQMFNKDLYLLFVDPGLRGDTPGAVGRAPACSGVTPVCVACD